MNKMYAKPCASFEPTFFEDVITVSGYGVEFAFDEGRITKDETV